MGFGIRSFSGFVQGNLKVWKAHLSINTVLLMIF